MLPSVQVFLLSGGDGGGSGCWVFVVCVERRGVLAEKEGRRVLPSVCASFYVSERDRDGKLVHCQCR